MRKPYIVFGYNSYTNYYSLNNEIDNKEFLEKLRISPFKSLLNFIYIEDKGRVTYLYDIFNGINFENLNKLYNYYDKDALAPIIMELKLKK